MRLPRHFLVFVAPTRWRSHALFVIGGVVVGLAAVLLAKLADEAQALSALLRGASPSVGFLLPPLGFALLAALTERYLPAAQGSGIPQVMVARTLHDDRARAELVSLKVAAGKVLLLTLGLFAGASIGREGPTVQVGGAIMFAASRRAELASLPRPRRLRNTRLSGSSPTGGRAVPDWLPVVAGPTMLSLDIGAKAVTKHLIQLSAPGAAGIGAAGSAVVDAGPGVSVASDCVTPGAACGNRLFSQLPADAAAVLAPSRTILAPRQVLSESRVPVTHIYFLDGAAASILTRAGDKGWLVAGVLGRTDLAGLSVVLGGRPSPWRCVVQVPGPAWRVEGEKLADLIDRNPAVRRVLLRYSHERLIDATEAVACAAVHSLASRLANYLMTLAHCLGSCSLPVTHSAISRALGARRPGVSTLIGQFERARLLRRARGRIAVTDMAALSRVACECGRMRRRTSITEPPTGRRFVAG